MEKIRAFIAIELPDELKRELGQLEARLKSAGPPGVRWVDPGSIHLTLKFLGDITRDKTAAITRAMEEAAQTVLPFQLGLKTLGVFPNLKRAQVAWVGISGEVAQLSQLQQSIESNLAHLGFTPEGRPFTAHLTLARLGRQVSLDERQRFGQFIAGTGFEASTVIRVEAINLMQSELTRAGAIYRRINLVWLKKTLANG